MLQQKTKKGEKKLPDRHHQTSTDTSEFYQSFLSVHETCGELQATPRRYMNFLHTYNSVYERKQDKIAQHIQHLQVNFWLFQQLTTLSNLL